MRKRAVAAALAAAFVASPYLQAQRADELLRELTLEQKAGQLFVNWILSRADDAARDRMKGWVRDVGLGGVVLSLGTVEEAADLIADLQSEARVPLIVAGDFEGGVAFRLDGATDMGNQMLLGATGLTRLSHAMGRVTGVEARALGFHWCYAPVLDVNVNPDNPIINVRAFGEDPRLVARMGAAFLRGVQEQTVLATGKHFPGHGDVASDSHLTMPTVPGDRERLEEIELRPFRAAVDAGLQSIMTGHLAVPGLGEDPAVPATLSRRILGGLLRSDMGFDGLVVTDALDMGGVKDFGPEEVAVRALIAGADVLLMPPDPTAARDAVIEAVRSGRVSEARLDEAVLRILKAKELVGLLAGRGLPDPRWREVVAAPAHLDVADEIAWRGVTLVRDAGGRVPLGPGETLVVTLLDKQDTVVGTTFAAALGHRLGRVRELRLHPDSGPEEVRGAADAVASAERVIAALFVRVRSYSGRIGLPESLQPVAGALEGNPASVAVSFGNPYLIRQFPGVGTYLCAYAGTPHTENAVAAALAGGAPITGRLPVRIPEIADAGEGLTFLPGREVPEALPETEGLDPALPETIRTLLEGAVADGAFPGAVCLVARRGARVAEIAVGRATYAEDAPAVTPDALFDMASLTKVCATTSAVLRLVAAGDLSLDTKVRDLLPEFRGPGKERVTLRHLLAHASGLPAYERYYRVLEGKEQILQAAMTEGLMTEPGSRAIYSDLGFMLLMACVEKATGEPFPEVCAREVFAPLGMAGARFRTGEEPLPAQPTEEDPARGGVVQGFVHDENAWAMGGVSGHAGLFATADDVLRLGLAYLGGGRGWLPPGLARSAVRPAGLVEGSSRAIGWDTLRDGGWGGTQVPDGAFGHTGFTGTSVWCDPGSDLCVVLLTNRVHPTRVNARITAVRRALHDLVLSAVER